MPSPPTVEDAPIIRTRRARRAHFQIRYPSSTCSEEEAVMRGTLLFVTGLAVGAAVQTGIAQNTGLVGLNHVAISVPNLDAALTYYTKTLGFPEAFRSLDEKGQPA